MKILVVSDNAGWVLDNIRDDFNKFTELDVVKSSEKPDIIWSLDFWSLKKAFSFGVPVVAHVHHINKEQKHLYNFDPIKSAIGCVTNNKFTFNDLKDKNVNKTIRQIPYWLLSKTQESRFEVDKKNDFFNIGSFQKDGQTNSKKPKMIKGPDILVKSIEEINKIVKVNVVLSGYCRDYVVQELKSRGISYELHSNVKNLNPLYDKLDAYIISSREEGGPQAVLEAAYRKIPIVSTDVGLVSDVIHKNCICEPNEISSKIFDCKQYIVYNYNNVLNYRHEVIIPKFDQFFKELLNGI